MSGVLTEANWWLSQRIPTRPVFWAVLVSDKPGVPERPGPPARWALGALPTCRVTPSRAAGGRRRIWWRSPGRAWFWEGPQGGRLRVAEAGTFPEETRLVFSKSTSPWGWRRAAAPPQGRHLLCTPAMFSRPRNGPTVSLDLEPNLSLETKESTWISLSAVAGTPP